MKFSPKGFMGGTSKNFKKNENLSKEGLILTEPDICSKKYYRESKGVRRYGDLKFLDEQIAKYFLLEMQEEGKKRIRFDIFRHDIENLQAKYKKLPLEKLVFDLTNNTLFSISLPFSTIFEMYNSQNDFTSRYDGEKYSTFTRLKSSGVNKLFFNLEETLESFGINTNKLIIDRRKSPYGLKINGMKIKPFPMIIVKDKTYPLWKKDILERFESREGIIPEFYHAVDILNNTPQIPLGGSQVQEGLFEGLPFEEEIDEETILTPRPEEDIPF